MLKNKKRVKELEEKLEKTNNLVIAYLNEIETKAPDLIYRKHCRDMLSKFVRGRKVEVQND